MMHNYISVQLGGDVSYSMNTTITHILNIRPDTTTYYAQTYNLALRHSSAVIMSETMHHSAVLTKSYKYNIVREDMGCCQIISHLSHFFLHPDVVQPATPNPHYRVVHFDVSGVDLTNSTLVKAEFRIFRAPNPQARASEQRVEIYQVNKALIGQDYLFNLLHPNKPHFPQQVTLL